MIATAFPPPMAGLLGALHGLLSSGGAGAGGPAAGKPAPSPQRPVVPGDRARWSFANGNVIFRNGAPIDPRGPEGQTIASILERQRRDREANARQRAYVAALRQSAIPRAVVEGRAGLDAIRLGPGLTLEDFYRSGVIRQGGLTFSRDLRRAVSEYGTVYRKERGRFNPGAHVSVSEALRRGLAADRLDVTAASRLLAGQRRLPDGP